MTKLGLLDQAFIKIEQGGLSLQYLAGAFIVDPFTSDYPLDAATLAEHTAAELEEIPLMRQKLLQDKLRIGTLQLREDPDFDVSNHVSVVHLGEKAGYDELTDYLGRFSVRRIDLDRPLWHIEVIDGLENGYFVLALHVHHSILDGVGAARALSSIWSDKPISAKKPRSIARKVDAQPGTLGLLGGAVAENLKRLYVDTPSFLLKNSGPIVKSLGTQISNRLGRGESREVEDGVSLPRVQKTSLNTTGLSDRRVVAYVELPLADIKALRKTHDCTVNDLALYLNSCALEHYFKGIGELVDFDLVSSMLINTRAADDASTGNSIGFARVNLHNTIGDARERLAAIARDTRAIKGNSAGAGTDNSASGDVDFGKLGDLISPILLEAMVYGINRFNLLEKAPPFVNTTVTNVPSPPGPTYCGGAKLVSSIPMAPCLEVVALTISVASSEDYLALVYHGCGETILDKALFVEGARLGLAALKKKSRHKASGKL